MTEHGYRPGLCSGHEDTSCTAEFGMSITSQSDVGAWSNNIRLSRAQICIIPQHLSPFAFSWAVVSQPFWHALLILRRMTATPTQAGFVFLVNSEWVWKLTSAAKIAKHLQAWQFWLRPEPV